MENLEKIIEAILFSVGRPVSKEEIAATLGINVVEVENAFEKLENEYNNKDTGISLVKVKSELQLVSNKKYFEFVSKFVENSKKQNISPSCFEVLSIIAYNPKITKSEIENIRGINSDSQVSRLLEYGLVEEVGRLKLPGRPACFSVTNEFLKNMGINKVEDLPDFDLVKTEDTELTIFKEDLEKKEELKEEVSEEK